MSVKKAFWILVVTTLINLAFAQALDRLGLIEGLLSPNGPSLVWLLPLAVVFYASRLAAWFIAPGLMLGALIESAVVSFRPRAR
jgi:hypothetical protein